MLASRLLSSRPWLGGWVRREKLNPRQTHHLRKLAFLAPDIMDRIITGDVPESLTLERLKKDFPVDWDAQTSD